MLPLKGLVITGPGTEDYDLNLDWEILLVGFRVKKTHEPVNQVHGTQSYSFQNDIGFGVLNFIQNLAST